MYRKIHRVKRNYAEYPPFDYTSLGYSKKDIPEFADFILYDPYVSTEEKKKFFDDFLAKYINDEIFRDNSNGKIIVMDKNKYLGVFSKSVNRKNIGTIGIAKVSILVGEVYKISLPSPYFGTFERNIQNDINVS